MFAEPAHFQADRDTVNLLPRARLSISDTEADALIAALNANFADRGLVFVRGNSGHWYVQCEARELPTTTPIHVARSGNLFEKLPQSRGKLSWKAIQNEAQMLLFSDPVNAAREGLGKLTINGLWFWGEPVIAVQTRIRPTVEPVIPSKAGIQPTVTHFEYDGLGPGLRRDDGDSRGTNKPNPSIGAVFGDISLAKGLAAWGSLPFAPLDRLRIKQPVAAHTVVMIDSLSEPLDRGDLPAWCDALTAIEQNVFAPLLGALRDGVIDEALLTLPRDQDALVFSLHAASFRGLRGWWQQMRNTPRPFLEYHRA
jgi:hypothetical protein